MKKMLYISLCMVMIVMLTACGHQHTWQEAACITPKTCVECGVTEGEALGHQWVAATCEEPERCSICGVTRGDALGHVWEKATCLQPEHCSICGATKNNTLGDHVCNTWSEVLDPTCSETGFKKGICINCGENFTVIIDKSPHNYGEWEITKQTSCVEAGEQTHVCMDCGYSESEEIARMEHDLDEWKTVKEATYNENGLREQRCIACKNTINSEEFSFAETIKDKVEFKGSASDIVATDAQINYKSRWGYISGQVIIEITNNSKANIKISKATLDITDKDGVLLETVEDFNTYIAPVIVEPGQKGYILADVFNATDELDTSNGLDIKAYVTAEKTLDSRSHWEFTDVNTKGNDPETVGHVKNADSTTYSYYTIYCLYRDKTGRVIGFTTAYGDELEPNDVESFGSYNSCSGLIKSSAIESVECIGVGYAW